MYYHKTSMIITTITHFVKVSILFNVSYSSESYSEKSCLKRVRQAWIIQRSLFNDSCLMTTFNKKYFFFELKYEL